MLSHLVVIQRTNRRETFILHGKASTVQRDQFLSRQTTGFGDQELRPVAQIQDRDEYLREKTAPPSTTHYIDGIKSLASVISFVEGHQALHINIAHLNFKITASFLRLKIFHLLVSSPVR
jgi:hypothetical protein